MTIQKQNIPTLRFPGFNGEWREVQIGEVAPIRNGYGFKSKEFTETGVPIVRISNITESGGVSGPYVYYPESGEYSRFTLEDGDTVLAMSGAATEKVGTLNLPEGVAYYQNQRVGYFTKTGEIDYLFLSTWLKSIRFEHAAYKYLIASAQANISTRDLNSIRFLAPGMKEQVQIGNFFKALDDEIQTTKEKINQLTQLKHGLLQQLFPQKGEDRPRLRFPGFPDAWERHKLSEVLTVNSGKDYKHLNHGNVPVYGTGGYMLSVDESLSDIDAIGLGRKGTINKPQLLKAPFWTVDTLFYLTPKPNNDLLFLHALIQHVNWLRYDESTGVPSLSRRVIDNLTLKLPSLPEQKIIGSLFQNLDVYTTLTQRKCDQLKTQKQALLQQMFI